MHPSQPVLPAATSGTFDFMAINVPPSNPVEKKQLDDYVTEELRRYVLGRLSRAETDLFFSSSESSEHDSEGKERVWDKLDEVLIEQAAYFGWRMYESRFVRVRIALWTDYNFNDVSRIDKLRRFNESLNRYAELKRGLKRSPLTEPEWHETRKNALVEIKALQKRLTARFAMSNSAHDAAEVSSAIQAEVRMGLKEYQYLSANLTSFMAYLEEQDSPLALIAGRTRQRLF